MGIQRMPARFGPGGARSSMEEPGGARRSQGAPGGARRSQEEPGRAKRSLEEQGEARGTQPRRTQEDPAPRGSWLPWLPKSFGKPRDARRTQERSEDPGGAWKSQKEPGTARNSQKEPDA